MEKNQYNLYYYSDKIVYLKLSYFNREVSNTRSCRSIIINCINTLVIIESYINLLKKQVLTLYYYEKNREKTSVMDIFKINIIIYKVHSFDTF